MDKIILEKGYGLGHIMIRRTGVDSLVELHGTALTDETNVVMLSVERHGVGLNGFASLGESGLLKL